MTRTDKWIEKFEKYVEYDDVLREKRIELQWDLFKDLLSQVQQDTINDVIEVLEDMPVECITQIDGKGGVFIKKDQAIQKLKENHD